MKQLLKNFKQISILLIIISFIGGCTDEDAFLPSIVSNFTHTTTNDSIVSFINISENASNYAWDFGDGSTSTEKNPIKAFTRNGDALQQDFIVALTATNSAGASAVFKDTLTISFPIIYKAMGLPINFDAVDVDYATSIVGNVSFEVIDNPELSGVNAEASKVGKITNTGENWENAFFNLDTPVDFTTNKSIKLKLYSTTALPIKLKFEDGTADAVEADVNHGGTGWEELTFDFDSSASYNDMVLFVDGPGTATGTFYIDDLEHIETAGPAACTDTMLVLPTDFECAGIDYAAKQTGDVDFSIIDNPQISGANAVASKVAQLVFDNNQVWENAFFNLDTAVDFSTNKSIKMKIYSTDALPIKLKFEGGANGAAAIEADVNHGGTGWEELTFDLNSSDSYSSLVLFVNGGQATTGTYYIDDIEQVATTTPAACTDTMLVLPTDFECAGIDYAAKQTGDVDFSIIDNPQISGANAVASKVAQLVFDNNQVWENAFFNLDTAVDFSTNKSIKMKIYSTDALPIKLKFEGGANGAAPTEADVNHGGTGWEELTFDLNSSDSYSSLVFFVNGGQATTGTYYIDDIEQVATAGGGTTAYTVDDTIDFETGGFGNSGFTWTVFENTNNPPAVEFVANPNSSGINTSATVAKITALQAGQQWAGCETAHGNITAFTLDATNSQVKVMVYKTVISDVGLKLVNSTNGTIAEIKVPNTVINQWEEITFDFSGAISSGDNNGTIDQLVFFPDFTARTADNIVYFDNITFSGN